jgi:hypothetical protein
MTDENRPETARVKSSLARLAESDDAAIIDRAAAAIEDVDGAAEFVETVGLDRLEMAVDAVDDAELESRGRTAIEAFHRFRRAATGSDGSTARGADQFHRGRGTTISDDTESPSE